MTEFYLEKQKKKKSEKNRKKKLKYFPVIWSEIAE